jgi:hypothetical protein
MFYRVSKQNETKKQTRLQAYRSASQDQRQSASQVPGHDGNDGNPNHPPVHGVVRPLEQPQVANQQSNFEEADAHLVYRPAGIVPARVRNQICLRTQRQWQPQAKLRF